MVTLFQNDTLLSFQIAFDLYESATQQFVANILKAIAPKLAEPETEPPPPSTTESLPETLQSDEASASTVTEEPPAGASESAVPMETDKYIIYVCSVPRNFTTMS